MSSPAGLVAVVSQSGETTTVRYLHGDHLGSTSAITDETGNVIERLSFDPHGKRRQPNGQDATTAITSSVNRGYTGHEMDDESGLINMNAREYDPRLGRFMQADVIADSFGGQGLNRYSYVHNNPLSATDPSGNNSRFFKRLTLEKLLKYGPAYPIIAPLVINPITTHPGSLTIKGVEMYVKVKKDEPWLLENPKYIPIAKAVISVVICYFTCEIDYGVTTAWFSGIYDARFTYLMGGDRTDQWQAFNRSYASTLLTSSVSQAFPVSAGASWESIAVTVAVRGAASGAAAEIQGGDFWQGFAMGAGSASIDYLFRAVSAASALELQNSDVNATGTRMTEQAGMLYENDSVFFGNDGLGRMEGGGFSVGANRVPGIRATAWAHDWITGSSPVGFDVKYINGAGFIPRVASSAWRADLFSVPILGEVLNYGTMVPAYVWTMGAMANQVGAFSAWTNARYTNY